MNGSTEHSPSLTCLLKVAQLAMKFPTVLKPETSLLCSQEPVTQPYSEATESSTQPHILLSSDTF
jgi:hypothetical protein